LSVVVTDVGSVLCLILPLTRISAIFAADALMPAIYIAYWMLPLVLAVYIAADAGNSMPLMSAIAADVDEPLCCALFAY
jgi:hypothetical protein